MKKTIKLLLSILLFQSQSYAINVRSIDKSIWTATEALRLQFPRGQVTSVGDKSFYIETGYKNILANPNFESTTLADGWGNTPGSSSFAVLDSGNQREGLRGVTVSMSSGTHTDMDAIYSNIVTPGIDWTGTNLGGSLWIKNANAGMKLCIRRLNSSSAMEAQTCVNLQTDGIWHEYVTPGMVGGDSTKKYMLAVVKNGTIPVGPAQTFQVDGEAYLGEAKLGYGAPPNRFTAKVSSAGVVSSETAGDWINGNCAVTSTSTYTCTFNSGFFTQTPNCETTPYNSVSGPINDANTNASQLQYSTYNAAGAATAAGATISCTKTGSDQTQNAITAQNWNREGTIYTPTIGGLGSGSVTNISGAYSLTDDKMFIRFSYLKDGTAGTGSAAPSITLPSGYEIDPAKYNSNTTAYLNLIGNATVNGTSYTLNFLPGTSTTSIYIGTSGSVVVAGAAVSGTAVIYIKGRSVSMSAPQLLGSVTSDALNAFRLETAAVTNNGSVCSAVQSSVFISAISRSGAGTCNMTVQAGTKCWTQATAAGRSFCRGIVSGTSLSVECLDTNSAPSVATDRSFDMLCVIPRQ